MYIGLHVTYLLFLLGFIKFEVSRQFIKKYPNIKSQENPPSGSQVVPCEWTDVQAQQQIVVYRNFANAPKNGRH